jgi:hypothetical protein
MVSNLISQKIYLIFASGAVAGRTAKDATSTIPIVCFTGDLVGRDYSQAAQVPAATSPALAF